jgi:hypothetical protein
MDDRHQQCPKYIASQRNPNPRTTILPPPPPQRHLPLQLLPPLPQPPPLLPHLHLLLFPFPYFPNLPLNLPLPHQQTTPRCLQHRNLLTHCIRFLRLLAQANHPLLLLFSLRPRLQSRTDQRPRDRDDGKPCRVDEGASFEVSGARAVDVETFRGGGGAESRRER